MNNDERRLWVLNDEGLYHTFKCSRLCISKFVKENKSEIDSFIARRLS